MLIIDAYNVLHAAAKVHEGLGGLTVMGLARLVRSSRWVGEGVVLVCDGSGGRGRVDDEFMHPEAPVRVVFAGPGKDADAAIERMVIEAERQGGGRGSSKVTVVSSDKGVLASAIGPIGPKARRMTSEQFLRGLVQDAGRDLEQLERGGGVDLLDKAEVEGWLRRFGADDAGDRSAPPGPGEAGDLPEGIDPDDLDMRKWLNER